jgi:hypothetical protein
MPEPVDDAIVAAHLAAALMQNDSQKASGIAMTHGGVTLERAAAKIYFDCFEALRVERAERQKAPAQS